MTIEEEEISPLEIFLPITTIRDITELAEGSILSQMMIYHETQEQKHEAEYPVDLLDDF